MRDFRFLAGLLLAGCAANPAPGPGASLDVGAATGVYHAWVTSESADQIARVRFGPDGAAVVHTRAVGTMPMEMDGPHGVAVSPDGRFIYVTLGHGMPLGTLWKIDVATDQVVGRTVLGRFPATVSVTPDGEYGFITNFNLHGDHVPSTVSKVHLPSMAEVARTETCVMPHGSRINRQGTRHYSVCMMNELVVELDAGTAEIARTFSVARGREGDAHHDHGGPAGGMGAMAPAPPAGACSPTWVEPSPDGSRIFVTCNRAREVLEIDVGRWEVVRRFPTGESPYNLAVTPDGSRLLVSLRNRTDPALEIYDLASGSPAGRVPASTTLVHGIAVSPDSRYAFISVEGVGAEPGRVDVIDLSGPRRVASVEVGQQATGIALEP